MQQNAEENHDFKLWIKFEIHGMTVHVKII